MRRKFVWLGLLLLTGAAGVVLAAANREPKPPLAGIRVKAEYPHDAKAFTQGLIVHDGVMYEGTGQKGESSLRKVDYKTGRVEQQMNLDGRYFGEGIATLDGKIYQLTWQNRAAFVYDLETMQYLKTLRYAGEGWGLTTDGKQLIMSDGSSTLKFINPETFATDKRILVKSGRTPVSDLNELEYIDGEIWANIWYSDRIVRIDPATGDVRSWIDLSSLYPARQRPSREHVLNGIAYDAESKQIFVTGKMWPKLFEIEVVK